MMLPNQESLVNTFTDTKMHEIVAGIIYAHATNKIDVRSVALEGLDFNGDKTILDLGCGFGFFTRSLKGRVSKNSNIMGVDRCAGYDKAFYHSCSIAGVKGNFKGIGAEYLHDIPTNFFDHIICSYALYFFPDVISQISRILKSNGFFVTITHSAQHLFELFSYVKKAFYAQKIIIPECLPYEKLIGNFNDKNGYELLSPYFGFVEEKKYSSSLIFKMGDEENFKKYLKFKQPFYVPAHSTKGNIYYDRIIERLCDGLRSGKPFRITKDDTIYVCYKPLLS